MTATTKTSIANLALTQVGSNPVQDIDTDPSPPAVILRAAYDICLDKLLAEIRPTFARRRIQLAADTTLPVGSYGYPYAFALPGDYVAIIENTTDAQYAYSWVTQRYYAPIQKSWDIVSDKILTYSPGPLDLDYISNAVDTGSYHPSFTKAFAFALAVDISLKLLQNVQLRNVLAARAEELYLEAVRFSSGLETPDQPLGMGPWGAVRLS
jgi:hypothetical protein